MGKRILKKRIKKLEKQLQSNKITLVNSENPTLIVEIELQADGKLVYATKKTTEEIKITPYLTFTQE